MLIAKLENKGVSFILAPTTSRITHVNIPFSPEEWCWLVNRNQAGYVGGCCGEMSHIQDIINYTLRFGPIFSSENFRDLGIRAERHDGFDEFKKIGEKIKEIQQIRINKGY